MADATSRETHESRTQSVGTKRSLTHARGNPRKRRRNTAAKEPERNLNSSENSFPLLSHHADSNSTSPHDPSTRSSSVNDYSASNKVEDPSMELGRNRLATGYSNPSATLQEDGSRASGRVTDASAVGDSRAGESPASVIEISDDEVEESDGGMQINLDSRDHAAATAALSEGEYTEESGEIASDQHDATDVRLNAGQMSGHSPVPALPVKRLSDLSADDLEDQLRYAYFALDRSVIDLNRPVVCLMCMSEGHLQDDCKNEETDLQVFPVSKVDAEDQIRLWISCCLCASKTHLVGDCPQMQSGRAACWSLKATDADRIINLSLGKGIKKLEIEAENRGMRPAGLQIRGRASMHRAGVSRPTVSGSSDDEPFLRRPVGRRQPDRRADPGPPQRYDRYNAPSENQSYRGGGSWYRTDSFGRTRARSRSPGDRSDNYRPRDDTDSAQTSSQFDSWRPQRDEYRQHGQARMPSLSQNGKAPTAATKGLAKSNAPGSNYQFSLPTRKGSNNWPQSAQSGNGTPPSNGQVNGGPPGRRRKKGKQK